MKCPVGSSNHLRDSIHHRLELNKGIIGTNSFYAPYVEFGTGNFAVNGNGRKGWWVYVDPKCQAPKGKRKIYTKAEATKVYWSLVKLYGKENVHLTNGQHPHPFLQPALIENKSKILEIMRKTIERNMK